MKTERPSKSLQDLWFSTFCCLLYTWVIHFSSRQTTIKIQNKNLQEMCIYVLNNVTYYIKIEVKLKQEHNDVNFIL
jgi:hypothetical protein